MTASPIDPTGELRELASDCVHCGFCLPACPTYQLWGEEMDSPRGRIHLITQLLDGGQASEAAASHLDRCLGCMACVPACPSGVRYDRLIEAARSWQEAPAARCGRCAGRTGAGAAPVGPGQGRPRGDLRHVPVPAPPPAAHRAAEAGPAHRAERGGSAAARWPAGWRPSWSPRSGWPRRRATGSTGWRPAGCPRKARAAPWWAC